MYTTRLEVSPIRIQIDDDDIIMRRCCGRTPRVNPIIVWRARFIVEDTFWAVQAGAPLLTGAARGDESVPTRNTLHREKTGRAQLA